jgi:hypothetical protein
MTAGARCALPCGTAALTGFFVLIDSFPALTTLTAIMPALPQPIRAMPTVSVEFPTITLRTGTGSRPP